MPLRNTAHGYGAVTKCLHWSVYLLFLYQYLGANLMTTLGPDPVPEYMAALKELGRDPAEFKVAQLRMVYVADSDDAAWEEAQHHLWHVFDYYRGLVALRRARPEFRLTSAGAIRRQLTFLKLPAGVVGFHLRPAAGGDVIAVFNATCKPVRIALCQQSCEGDCPPVP